ncbi:DUF2007 domain-containing protein [soil metagenome]
MQKLYSSENLVFLYLLQSKLVDKGISCIIKNEVPPAAGEIPPVEALPELWLTDKQHFIDAMQIIQYELSSLGTSKKAWYCPQCGESLEGQFDICWKCGQSKIDNKNM